jgi:uncharacterized protein (TIGR04222 family)
MTNPFTLRGPDFLLLFLFLCILVHLLVHAAIVMNEARVPAKGVLRDPYLIAYLRAGTLELVRVVGLSLALRGLLAVSPRGLMIIHPGEVSRATLPIERAVLQACRPGSTLTAIAGDGEVRLATQEYQRRLADSGLLPNARAKRARKWAVLAGTSILAFVAFCKIVIALDSGHSNISFLMILASVAILLLLVRFRSRLTSEGVSVLKGLKALFADLNRRSDQLAATAVAEATLLAAVFGVYINSGTDPVAWRKVFPLQSGSPADTIAASSVSSCSSSGCGGGSGGGGCGGCGS